MNLDMSDSRRVDGQKRNGLKKGWYEATQCRLQFGVGRPPTRPRALCHESRGKESPSKTSTNSEPLLDALVATQSKTTKGRKPIQIAAEHALHAEEGEKQQSYDSSTSTELSSINAVRLDRESD